MNNLDKFDKFSEMEKYFREKFDKKFADAIQATIGCDKNGDLIISVSSKEEYIEEFKIIKIYDKELIYNSINLGLNPHPLIDEINEILSKN